MADSIPISSIILGSLLRQFDPQQVERVVNWNDYTIGVVVGSLLAVAVVGYILYTAFRKHE
jgi:uncharacterized protein (DUF2062 family)